MGVLFIAATFVDRLNREWHIEALLSRAGRGGPVVAGAAFSPDEEPEPSEDEPESPSFPAAFRPERP